MIRDVQIGPLCRFFARDAAEAAARIAGVHAWMADMSDALGSRIPHRLDWREDLTEEPDRLDLGERGWPAMQLVAVYTERTDLELPSGIPDPLVLDATFRAAQEGGFTRSNYGHLLAARAWLPLDFDFTCAVPRPDGEDWSIGSLPALRDQLRFLAQRTLGVAPETLRDVRDIGDPVLSAFMPAIAVLHEAATRAIARGLPMVLIDGH